jgi:hypothetical protein
MNGETGGCRRFDRRGDIEFLGVAVIVVAGAVAGSPEVEPEDREPSIDQAGGHPDHERGHHRTALNGMWMTEDDDTGWLVGGIPASFQRFTIRGVEVDSLDQMNSIT